MAATKKTTSKTKTSTSKVLKASAVAGTAAAPRKRAAGRAVAVVNPAERLRMIEQAAYFRAEKAGFMGDSHEHWVAAEAEVDAILGKSAKGGKGSKKKK